MTPTAAPAKPRVSEAYVAVLAELIWPVAVAWQRVIDTPKKETTR